MSRFMLVAVLSAFAGCAMFDGGDSEAVMSRRRGCCSSKVGTVTTVTRKSRAEERSLTTDEERLMMLRTAMARARVFALKREVEKCKPLCLAKGKMPHHVSYDFKNTAWIVTANDGTTYVSEDERRTYPILMAKFRELEAKVGQSKREK